jgi:hypothetical protein
MKSKTLFCVFAAIFASISTPAFAAKEVQILDATVVQSLNTDNTAGNHVKFVTTVLTELEDFDTQTKSKNYTQGYSTLDKSASTFSYNFCNSFARDNNLYINEIYTSISHDITTNEDGITISNFTTDGSITLSKNEETDYEGVLYSCSTRLYGSMLPGDSLKNGQIEMTVTRVSQENGEASYFPITEKYLFLTF